MGKHTMKNTLIFLSLMAFTVSAYSEDGKGISVKGLDKAGSPEQENPLTAEYRKPLPVYMSELTNINDYNIFGNAGWDGNWYVGFNACWMEEIPQPPAGEYKKAFVGVKLGRMKTRRIAGKPVWEKEAIPGLVYAAIASTPAWKSNQQYFIASSEDIPLEADAENALEGVGEARWFWAQVPIESVNLNGPSYIAVWSPSEYFVSVASAPILAGGWGSKKANSWISNDIKGYPPNNSAAALKTPISVFEPAIILKLIPEGCEQEIPVTVSVIKDGRDRTSNKTFVADIGGDGIEKAWLEISADGNKWVKNSRIIYSAPYMLTLLGDKMPEGKIKVRAAAVDIWGNMGYSKPVEIVVTKTTTK